MTNSVASSNSQVTQEDRVQLVLSQANFPPVHQLDAWETEIERAKERIHKHLSPSPLKYSPWLSSITQSHVWLKLECLNPNGSFKVRGALNAISKLVEEKGACRVVCASAGNHAQGVAYAAQKLGCEAHIFLPAHTPLVKREACESLGAKIYVGGDALNDSMQLALDFAKTHAAEFIHPFNSFEVVCGQASLFAETLEQFENLNFSQEKKSGKIDSFLCCVGGGGLISGVAMASQIYKSHTANRIEVYGAEQEFFDSAYVSLQEKKWLPKSNTSAFATSIADGISVKQIGNLNYEVMSHFVDRVFVCSDDNIVGSILGLCEREHVVTEGAGAVAVACLQKYKSFFEGKNTVVTVSGGNIDPQLLSRVVTRGLGVTGRVLKTTVCVLDRPGKLRELLEKIASLDANVLEVYHDRTYAQVHVGQVDVDVSLETKNFEHQYQILESLAECGYKPKVKS
jgi:threonine dehydratase